MLERLGSIGLLFFLGGGRDEVQDRTLGNGRATWLVIDKSPLYKQKDHICMGARDRRDRIFGMGWLWGGLGGILIGLLGGGSEPGNSALGWRVMRSTRFCTIFIKMRSSLTLYFTCHSFPVFAFPTASPSLVTRRSSSKEHS